MEKEKKVNDGTEQMESQDCRNGGASPNGEASREESRGEESRERAVRIGSLWNRTSEDGKHYKSGVVDFGPLGELHVALFRETEKKSDKHPDYVMICEKARIGAFWLRTSGCGRKFLSGHLLGVPVNIFRNESKQSEKSPDYRIVRFMETQEEAEPEEDF